MAEEKQVLPSMRLDGRVALVTGAGRGIGRALWVKLEARAAALGANRIGADSDPAAVPFYLRMGMEPAGEAPSGSIPGRRLPRLVKVLTAPQVR